MAGAVERLSLSVRIGICWFLVEKAQFHIHNIHHYTEREEKRNFTFKPNDMEYNGNRKPDITPDTTYIQTTKLHTHSYAANGRRRAKSFYAKLFAHLNYKLDYESCDWISDVIVIMYSFRKM